MSMWVQTKTYIVAWIHCIIHKRIQAPWRPPFLTIHHPPTIEASTCPTKKCSYKNCTQLDSLPLELLHNIDMWHASIVNCKKLKRVSLLLKQHHPVICASTSNKLKYVPFYYYTHYYHIKYVWAYRCLGHHNSFHGWGKEKLSNMKPYNVTWPFNTSHPSQRLICILNKVHYKNLHNYISNFFKCLFYYF